MKLTAKHNQADAIILRITKPNFEFRKAGSAQNSTAFFYTERSYTMTYTTTMSIFFLLAACAASFALGTSTRRTKAYAAFWNVGDGVRFRPILIAALVIMIAGNIIGIGTLPTL